MRDFSGGELCVRLFVGENVIQSIYELASEISRIYNVLLRIARTASQNRARERKKTVRAFRSQFRILESV
jgi:hypothetical protein